MNTVDILSKELTRQSFLRETPAKELLEHYCGMARSYARIENAIAVLSDIRSNTSYIYYGKVARLLDTGRNVLTETVSSIWEEEIFGLIHPDDLNGKHLHELCFFNYTKKQPKSTRFDYFMAEKIRMRNSSKGYTSMLHRIIYIPDQYRNNIWLALCLYSPLYFEMPAKSMIVNSATGEIRELDSHNGAGILSAREKQVLSLIDKGMSSKEIAEFLFISKNTVSRHRQEILSKLQVKNSIEACRVAKDLELV